MKKIINNLAVFTNGNKENRPVVFIHGFPFDHCMWEKQIAAFQSKFYCVTYDIRGLGESYVGDGQYTMESYVDDLFTIISELELEKPIICGLSMGGYIALRAVEREQDKIGGLILCDTKAEADPDAGKIGRAAKIKQINLEGMKAFVADAVPPTFSGKTREEKPGYYLEIIERAEQCNPLGVKGAILAMLSRTSTAESLSNIAVPTLVIVGEEDALSTPEVMKGLSDKIPNSIFTIIPDAGHMAPVENSLATNEAIDRFLKA